MSGEELKAIFRGSGGASGAKVDMYILFDDPVGHRIVTLGVPAGDQDTPHRIVMRHNAHPQLLGALRTARAVIQEDRDEVFASATVGGDPATLDDLDRPSVERLDSVLATIDAAILAAGGQPE